MKARIRWGILGTGNIARQFAAGLQVLADAELMAVGSRTQKSADAFADQFQIPHRHPSYEALAQDPDVDVIYIATPHPMHHPNALLCLDSGKAVLCEKPFTINQKEAAEVVARARAKGLFLMEAMWTRFLPTLNQTRDWLAQGIIGKPLMVRADFGFRAEVNEEGRLFAPEYGGGGLLDVGIYPISLAAMVFGAHPEETAALAHIGMTGVDDQNAVIFKYANGGIAITASAIRTNTPQDAIIMGENGSIFLHAPFWRGSGVTLNITGREPEVFDFPLVGNGYNYQAQAVMDCLRAGLTECSIMPLDETVAIMGILDAARAQWGVKYPME